MAEKKKENVRKTTPRGLAKWPFLSTPDTRFKDEGEYKVNLCVPEKEASKMMTFIKKMVDAEYANSLKGLKPALKKKLKKHYPFGPEYDKDDNETGNIEFLFRSNASYKNKKGDIVEMSPALFDAFGNPITKKINVGNGSEIKINFTPSAYTMPPSMKKEGMSGVKLYLNGVQIIKLVEFGGASAESMGFEAEEDGFEFDGSEDVDSEPGQDETDF